MTEWFVVNARDAQWRGGNGRSPICSFEAPGRFPQLGVNLTVLEPGTLGALYHEEGAQEDFLVLAGHCLAIVDEQEHRLGPWDFLHCPAGTPHVLAALDEPCLVVQVGARPPAGLRYPESEAARRHGAAVDAETSSVAEAYGERRRVPIPYEGWLDRIFVTSTLAKSEPGAA